MIERMIAGVCIFVAAGCAQQKPPTTAELQAGWLSFVRDGQTAREQVVLRLGTPTAEFENQRILTYRLHCGKDDMIPVPRIAVAGEDADSWEMATHELVLVFDD